MSSYLSPHKYNSGGKKKNWVVEMVIEEDKSCREGKNWRGKRGSRARPFSLGKGFMTTVI